MPLPEPDASPEALCSIGRETLRADYGSAQVGRVELNGETVEHPLTFTGCHFTDTVDLENAELSEATTFTDCHFDGVVTFENATFEKDVSFNRCTFDDAVFFRGATFPNRVQFMHCTFSDLLTMAGGRTEDAYSKTGNVCINHLKFEDCTFLGYTTFNNRHFTRSTTFRRCDFHQPPHFQRADMHQGTAFDSCRFRVPAGDDSMLAKSERAFRRLRTFAGAIGDTERRNEFAVLEFKTRRRRTDLNSAERMVIWAYQMGSDFGRSLVRPFVILGTSSISLFLLVLAATARLESPPAPGALVWFLFQHIVSPFSVAAWDFRPALEIARAYRELPWLFRVVGVTQSLITLGMVGLFIFAVRRRFVD